MLPRVPMLPRVFVGPRPVGRPPTRGRRAGLAAVLVVLTGLAAACSGLTGSTAAPTPTRPATTGPPPGASQAPGPPLATASPPAAGLVNPRDPASVAASCFIRWQSFDARTDDPAAGVRRARSCMTSDFYTSLGGGASQPASAGWLVLKTAATRSTVDVLAVSPLGPDTRASGRVVFLLNARRTTVAKGAAPVVSVTTPALTLLRQLNGIWLVAAADLAGSYGQAPGR